MLSKPVPTLLSIALLATACRQASRESPGKDEGFRGILVSESMLSGSSGAAYLDAAREAGHGAVAIEVGERSRPDDLARLAKAIESARLEPWLWIPAGRNPELAARRPDWVGGMGAHEDWRRRFPSAPRPGEGERIGVHPWTPIRYRDVLEDRVERIAGIVERSGARSVFLAALQGPPSACGCGNDRCRWTADYGMAGGPPQVEGSPSALILLRLRERLPGVRWVPVWVTECEEEDGPGGTTGLCGSVGCFEGLCWEEWSLELEPLLRTHEGPVALLLPEDPPGPGGSPRKGGVRRAIELAGGIRPRPGRERLSAGRIYAILEGGTGETDERRAVEEALSAGARGVLVARTRIDESWEPRIIPVVPRGTPGDGPEGAHRHGDVR